MKKNPLRRAALLAVIIMIVAAGIFLISRILISGTCGNERADRRGADNPPVAVVEKKEKSAEVPSSNRRHATGRSGRAAAFTSNEDIRLKYGRIETVHLFNGRSFTGAVIATDTLNYTIVTVAGVMKVPMRQVKMLDIIR